jgi:selenocysteine-specific elongation factor
MIVIGTAGHIDHGKSAVVRRLTGTDPDRLPEEKKRGLTIDLGFAFMKAHGGEELAFVDVPGHERFVRNMIAGAGGIDAVMLVVAADDGWMPQSQEHFQIIRLLGVKYGFIVINKIDLVEKDWLDLLEDDVRTKVTHSVLQGAPIFRVSAETGEGFDSLKAYLDELPARIQTRKDYGKARLYIDRSFIRPGMGGVVTGTLKGGSLSVGQSVLVWPARKTAKIRTLQSHNEDTQRVSPGHRTAVSFTGIERESLDRGGVLADRLDADYFVRNPVLALSVHMLSEALVPLSDRRQVVLLLVTTESQGEVRIFHRNQIAPGEEGIVFYRPEEPLYTLVADRYVMRLPTPMVTLGGGMVLDHLPRFPRRKHLSRFDYLQQRTSGRIGDFVSSELEHRLLARRDGFLAEADFGRDEIASVVDRLRDAGDVDTLGDYICSSSALEDRVKSIKSDIEKELDYSPHLKGLSLDRVASLTGTDAETTRVLLEFMISKRWLAKVDDEYTVAGRAMSLKGGVKQAHDEIMAKLQAEPYAPPALSGLASGGKLHQQAIKYILDTGEAHKCGSSFLYLPEVWKETLAFIRERIRSTGKLAVAELRERFGYTRKYAIPILEETDRLGITRREGDYRVKGDSFET